VTPQHRFRRRIAPSYKRRTSHPAPVASSRSPTSDFPKFLTLPPRCQPSIDPCLRLYDLPADLPTFSSSQSRLVAQARCVAVLLFSTWPDTYPGPPNRTPHLMSGRPSIDAQPMSLTADHFLPLPSADDSSTHDPSRYVADLLLAFRLTRPSCTQTARFIQLVRPSINAHPCI
jgi:hypothetical protein